MKRSIAMSALLALTLTACDDVIGIGGRDFEGFFSFAGTVDGEPHDTVLGTFTVTRQRGDRAEVTIEWSYIDDGEEIIYITTNQPAIADLDADGDIYFEFEGDLDFGDEIVSFRLTHDGRMRGGRITGYWDLQTGLPTTDAGTFTAQRN